MKVHITLREEVRHSSEAKCLALRKLQTEAKVQDVNLRRFERHGIVSGEMLPENLSIAKMMDEVQSVSVDSVQQAATPLPN